MTGLLLTKGQNVNNLGNDSLDNKYNRPVPGVTLTFGT